MPKTNHYIQVCLIDVYNKQLFVQMHILVAKSFIPIKPIVNGTLVVNHKDGVRWHNEVQNLEWCSQSYNIQDADKKNLIARPFGEDNSQSSLTDEQYLEICKLTEQGYFPNQINNMLDYGKDITEICQKIRRGVSETLISKDFDFSNIPRNDYRKFSEEQVRYICECLQNAILSYTEILNNLGYYENELGYKAFKKLRDTISCIKRKVSYIEISKDYLF